MSCGCRSPVIASRSSCRAVADHIRNVNDGKLRVPVENGGVITINFYPAYIDEEASRKTKGYFPPESGIGDLLTRGFAENGLLLRGGDNMNVAPPLCVTSGEIDEIVSTMDRVFAQASKELGAE